MSFKSAGRHRATALIVAFSCSPLSLAAQECEARGDHRKIQELQGKTAKEAAFLMTAPEVWIRARAIEIVAKENFSSAIPEIVTATSDPCPSVRRIAVWSLGRFDHRESAPRVIELLKDKDVNVRETATRTLGIFMDPRAVSPLISALDDESSNVRDSAAQSLGKIGDKRATPHLVRLLRDKRSSYGAAAGLALLGDTSIIPVVEALLKDKDDSVRWVTNDLLWQLKVPYSTKELINTLNSNDGRAVQKAAERINIKRDPAAIDPLIYVLENGTIGGRANAAMCLAWVKATKAVDPLMRQLSHEEDVVVRTSAYALAEIGDPRAVPALRKVQNHEDDSTRANIRTAIRKLTGRDDPLFVADEKRAQDAAIQKSSAAAAQRALEQRLKLSPQSPTDVLSNLLLNGDSKTRLLVLQYAKVCTDRNADYNAGFVAALKDGEPAVRVRAAECASQKYIRVDSPTVIPTLKEMLTDKEGAVRASALNALRTFYWDDLSDQAIKALLDADSNVRLAAAIYLGWHPSEKTVLPLIAALKDSDAKVRQWAAQSLVATGDQRGLEPLRLLLSDPNRHVRERAENGIFSLSLPKTNKPAGERRLTFEVQGLPRE